MTGRSDLPPAPRSRFALPKEHHGVLDDGQRARALDFVRALLEAPTAPYFEDLTLAVVRRFAAERPGLAIAEDEHKNVVITWPGAKPKARQAALAFSAHLDHPGFHYAGLRGGVHTARFHGGVPARNMPGAGLRFFAPTGTACATAVVASAESHGEKGLIATLGGVRGKLARGSFGVFDLTDGVLRGARLSARVCDDLMGAAAILALLDECVRAQVAQRVVGIFTRAEETGFVGCIGLLESRLIAPDTLVVGLECSPRRTTAVVGRGPVIRVGDRLSVFDPAVTAALEEAARRVAARSPGLLRQRALMDGGSCESTAYNAWGLRAGAMCLALGNYHNCGPRQTIAPEFVDWDDFEGLVAIMLECARGFDISIGVGNTRARLKHLYDRESERLTASARRLVRPIPEKRGKSR
jgi:endoglucanase